MQVLRILVLLGVILFSSISTSAQKSVNDYKYIVIPARYDFLKEADSYQMNSLTKFLFNKYGYIAFIQGDDIPEDLKANGCKGLQVNLKKNGTLFLTKLLIELSDCNNDIVFTSVQGVSREKEFGKAYHEALRNAFKDVQKLNYTYNKKKEQDQTPKVVAAPQSQVKTKISSDKSIAENKEQPKSDIVAQTEKSLVYTFNETNFVFKIEDYGYQLFQKKGETKIPFGKVYKMKKDNSYLIEAGDLSGGGYFDGYGNFIIERINPVTNKLIMDTLARQ